MTAAAKSKLEWCIVRLGQDMNWWVDEISDPVHWDVDGLSILDPRQIQYIIDIAEPLIEYGFDPAMIDDSFFRFSIKGEESDGRIRLVRVRTSAMEPEEPLFALPDVVDEEKGPYADFLASITKGRVKLLNDSIEFKQSLTVDELEDEIRDRNSQDYMEGRATHVFTEVTNILEYVPEGYELEDEEAPDDTGEIDSVDIPDLDEDDEKIEEDETMKWDDDEGEDSGESGDDFDSVEDEDEDDDEPRA